MPKEFWSEYRTAAGVFTIGEVFNGDPKYVSGYQGALDATLNYPMYYKLQAAFQQRKSMYNIHNGVNAEVGTYVCGYTSSSSSVHHVRWGRWAGSVCYYPRGTVLGWCGWC